MKYLYVPIYARNVLFSKSTEEFLAKLLNRANKPEVKKYIQSNLRTWLINEYTGSLHKTVKPNDPDWVSKALERGDKIYDITISNADKQKFNHWIDFLNQYDKPESLKQISVPQLIEHVKKWEESFQKSKDSEEDGISDLHIYPDGFRWVSVFGENSLKLEGKRMNHCVGGYYAKVKSGKCKIFSLRDVNGKPHITIEYNPKVKQIEQIKGNSNREIKKEYLHYLADFLKKNYIKFSKIDLLDLADNGLFFANGQLYNINDIPDNLTIKGNIDLNNTRLSRLPNNLKVYGDLDVSHTDITQLPDNLIVTGDLNLRYTNIEEIPSSLSVGGVLDARLTKIKSRKDIKSQKIKGKIRTNIMRSIDGVKYNIFDLPDNLTVDGNLGLRDTKITKLPKNLTVNYDLMLDGSSIEELPENLVVKRNLDISDTKIKSLPDSLYVGRTIFAADTPLEEIPEKLKNKIVDDFYEGWDEDD